MFKKTKPTQILIETHVIITVVLGKTIYVMEKNEGLLIRRFYVLSRVNVNFL